MPPPLVSLPCLPLPLPSFQNNVTHEVSTVINMSALAMSQLLESAQDKGVDLQLETSALENEALLKVPHCC